MSSSMTFPALIHILQILYSSYADKHGLNSIKEESSLSGRAKQFFMDKIFSSSDEMLHTQQQRFLDPDEFVS